MKLYPIIFSLVVLSACSTPKDIAYFQDREPGTSQHIDIVSEPFKVAPGDRISIRVKSRNEQLTEQFNIDNGQNGMMSGGQNGRGYGGYVVDDNGEIDFPVLGKLKVAGKNRQQIKEEITDTLRSTRLVDDAVVSVEYSGLYVSVLGQAGGRYININKDKYTILELLAECGDLNIDSKRQNILVIRNEEGIRSQYELDLCSLENIYNSPAYYIHQNDVVYIEPNDKTKRNSTVNGNLFQTWGFWTGLTGLGMTIYSIINLFVK